MQRANFHITYGKHEDPQRYGDRRQNIGPTKKKGEALNKKQDAGKLNRVDAECLTNAFKLSLIQHIRKPPLPLNPWADIYRLYMRNGAMIP